MNQNIKKKKSKSDIETVVSKKNQPTSDRDSMLSTENQSILDTNSVDNDEIDPDASISRKIDYKNIPFLQEFISAQGKILSRSVTKLSSKQQRIMTRSIKYARILALLPFVSNDPY